MLPALRQTSRACPGDHNSLHLIFHPFQKDWQGCYKLEPSMPRYLQATVARAARFGLDLTGIAGELLCFTTDQGYLPSVQGLCGHSQCPLFQGPLYIHLHHVRDQC